MSKPPKSNKKHRPGVFPSAAEDASYAATQTGTPQTESAAYRLAFTDDDFMLRQDLRPVRLQLELLKPELGMLEQQIESTIAIFGGTGIRDPEHAAQRLATAEQQLAATPDDESAQHVHRTALRGVQNAVYYEQARELGRLIGSYQPPAGDPSVHVITGGGPGIMAAANRGAADAGASSIGLNIVLPEEQAPNEWVTPSLSFRFHYFALRKMHFLLRARAVVAFPGGFGTLDELVEALTLVQTRKIKPLPILVFGREFWERVINFDTLVEEGLIKRKDIELMTFVDSVEEAWDIIQQNL